MQKYDHQLSEDFDVSGKRTSYAYKRKLLQNARMTFIDSKPNGKQLADRAAKNSTLSSHTLENFLERDLRAGHFVELDLRMRKVPYEVKLKAAEEAVRCSKIANRLDRDCSDCRTHLRNDGKFVPYELLVQVPEV